MRHMLTKDTPSDRYPTTSSLSAQLARANTSPQSEGTEDDFEAMFDCGDIVVV